jgi:hypothetical protein
VWIVLTARPGSGISIVPRTRAYVGFARQGASPKTQWSPRPGGVPSVPIRPSRSSPVALVVHPLRARTLQRLNAIDRRPKRRAQPCGASAAVAAVENTTRWMANLTSQLVEFQLSNGVRTGLRTSSVRRKVPGAASCLEASTLSLDFAAGLSYHSCPIGSKWPLARTSSIRKGKRCALV